MPNFQALTIKWYNMQKMETEYSLYYLNVSLELNLSLGIRTWHYCNFQIVLNTPANPFLNQGTKKYLLNFPNFPKKIMGREI